MDTFESLRQQYKELDKHLEFLPESSIRPEELLTFEYEYIGKKANVVIDTDEFTSVCPWSGLPDFGNLTVSYTPHRLCIELKSLKYYLLSYRNVGIVQEHAANKILRHLVEACDPIQMTVTLDYRLRGGVHTTVSVDHEKT